MLAFFRRLPNFYLGTRFSCFTDFFIRINIQSLKHMMSFDVLCTEYGRTSHVYNWYVSFYHSNYQEFPFDELIVSFGDIFCTCSDTFDENTPPLSDPNYISSLGAATFRAMQSGDDDAIWLMQVSSFEVLKCC